MLSLSWERLVLYSLLAVLLLYSIFNPVLYTVNSSATIGRMNIAVAYTYLSDLYPQGYQYGAAESSIRLAKVVVKNKKTDGYDIIWELT